MKNIVLFFLLVAAGFAGTAVVAAPVDSQTARRVAANFYKVKGLGDVELVDISSSMPYREFYTFVAEEGRGFVIVAADDCVRPVLGYSTRGTFQAKDMPSNVRGWLEDYESQIRYCRQEASTHGVAGGSPQSDTVRGWWTSLLNAVAPAPKLSTAVAPLITTQWGQGQLYNSFCPYDSTFFDHAVVGCVATATAQVMKYWNYPATGWGSHSYVHPTYGTLGANYGSTTYAWSSMPDSLTYSSSYAQINAVAKLMYHIGVAIEMQYGSSAVGGSGAYTFAEGPTVSEYGTTAVPCAENALRYYFKYRSNIGHINYEDYGDHLWSTLLTNEMNQGRPVIYAGRDTASGHSFVCDGYDNDGLFHFNWGWTGKCDGYYAVGSLNLAVPTGTDTSYHSYNIRNGAVIRISPNYDFDSTTVVTAITNTGSVGFGTVAGGGTYTGTNSNLVTLTATAAQGCRFEYWSDGYRYNPRTFYANGGTYSFKANFAPLQGDTLGYCSMRNLAGYQSGSNTVWGIKLPTSCLTAGHNLTKVQLYAYSAGSYTLKVYTGSSSRTLVYSQSFTVPASLENRWCQLSLTTPVTVTGGQPLWIVFESTAPYPAAVTYYAGNNDSRLWGSSLSTFPLNFSFMIKGIFSNGGSGSVASNDTVSFCDTASYASPLGMGLPTGFDWGIKLPPSMVSHQNYVSQAMLYVPHAGTYTLNIYRGAAANASNRLLSQTVVFDDSCVNTWQTIRLYSPIATSTTLPIWITFHNDDVAYPAATCAYTGDSNSSLLSVDNGATWLSLNTATHGAASGSWMIRAILSDSYTSSMSMYGPDTVGVGVPATIKAFASSGSAISWTLEGATPATATGATVTAQWPTPGSYQVACQVNSSGTILNDTVDVTVVDCGVTAFPYTMGFEASEGLHCWNMVDADNDGYGWRKGAVAFGSANAHGGSDFFVSASDISYHPGLTPDNWLVSPPIHLDSNLLYTLTWFDGALDSLHHAEHYSVYVSTTGNSPADFVAAPIFTTTLTTHAYTQRSVDLSAYAGQTVYIAFRHHNTGNNFWLRLDDITISESLPPTTYTITVLSDNPGMGSVSGGGSFLEGTVTSIMAAAFSGFHFVQWNDGNTNAVRSITVTGDVTYTAFFAANAPETYTVTVYSDNPTMGITSGGGTFASGTTTTITATALSGYHFVRWNDDNTDAVRTITVTANVSYIAYFAANAPNTYTVTVLSNDSTMGTVDGSGTFEAGIATTITATALSGYRFVQWNDGNTNAIRAIVVTADVVYTAYFAQEETPTYTITVMSVNNDMGIASGGGTYPQGTVITIMAEAFPGYQFDRWHDGITDNPRTVIVTSDATYVANFVALQGIEEVEYDYRAVALPQYTIMLTGVANQDVAIYDMMGRRLYSQRCQAEQVSVSMPSAGVYFVAVGTTAPRRLVLVR